MTVFRNNRQLQVGRTVGVVRVLYYLVGLERDTETSTTFLSAFLKGEPFSS